MEKRIVITTNDYQRLSGLIDFAAMKTRMPEIVSRLSRNLLEAKRLPQENISNDIITMNSRVLLRDLRSEREAELTISYPDDADNLRRKVSVFSSIGIELLGRQVGDVVSWKTPAGHGKFKILKITYQPEAMGDYFL